MRLNNILVNKENDHLKETFILNSKEYLLTGNECILTKF